MEHLKTDWLLFSDDLVPEWERCASERIAKTLGSSFHLAVKLILPTKSDAKTAWDNNEALYGSLNLSVGSEKRLDIPLPMSFDGVFIRRGQKGPQAYAWSNWLTEKSPGIRRLGSDGDEKKTLASFRIACPDGSFVEVSVPKNGKGTKPSRDKAIRQLRRVASRLSQGLVMEDGGSPPWFSEFIASVTSGAIAKQDANERLFGLLCEHVNDFPETRKDDLAHRALMTFPRWLAGNLCRVLKLRLDKMRQDENYDPPTDGSSFLARLAESKEPLALVPARLFPVRQGEEEEDAAIHPFVRLSAGNPVELMARITNVKRHRLKKQTRGFLPVSARQNDPSFEGRLCPFETPESELIGLSLQLARGAWVDAFGTIQPAGKNHPLDCLGWGTALIPFSNYNDGARNMMGAKNLRQATRIAGRQTPSVTTGAERDLVSRTARLVDLGVLPDCTCDGNLALGRDLLVAYMPWDGWNVDDAVVVRRGIVNDMAIEEPHVVSYDNIDPGWTCEVPKDRPKNQKREFVLRPGDTIATLFKPGNGSERGEPIEIKYNDPVEAILKCPPKPFGNSTPGKRAIVRHTLKFKTLTTIPLGPGDKLMGRHGNKGVVGLVLDDAEMPRLPDDPRLPATMRGKPIDILLNPHGVLSRMNPGQLLETHIGWLLHADIQEESLLATDSARVPAGTPNAKLDHNRIRDLLEKTGLNRDGAVRLVLPDGKPRETDEPVVVGFQHFVRLHHVPILKAQARRGGFHAAYSPTTNQPSRGRLIGGGQRLGEMEVWALAAHGAGSILREMLGVKSDALLARVWADSDKKVATVCGPNEGFASVLKDWLFALGIDLLLDGKQCRFSLLSDKDILSRIGKNRQVSDTAGPRKFVAARFANPDGSSFPGEYRVDVGKSNLSLADFLAGCGYRCPGSLVEVPTGSSDADRVYKMDLNADASDHFVGNLKIKLSFRNNQQKSMGAEVRPVGADGSPLALNGMDRFSCRLDLRGSGVQEFIEAMKKGTESFPNKAMLCARGSHSKKLRASMFGASFLRGKPNSLYDERIFGDLQTGDGGWGYLQLSQPVRYTKKPDPKKPDMARSSLTSVIPVLPLRYRLPRHDSPEGDDFRSLNQLYKAVLASDNDKVQEAVYELYERIAKIFEGKLGLLRREGLGRRVDRSFRLVITPDPELDWNQCGIPAPILEKVVGDFFKEENGAHEVASGEPVTKTFRNGGMSWRSGRKHSCGGKKLADSLNSFLKRHPDLLVLLNRQPSLHRDSIQAFRPVATNPEDGEVLRISPLCCKGFGADFDGDEMVGHVPVSFAARDEATKLLPENNLISIASGEFSPNYDRDLVTGLQLIFESFSDYKTELDQIGLGDYCLAILGQHDPKQEPGECSKELLRRLCTRNGESKTTDPVRKLSQLARLAWKACTNAGFSFGFYDLIQIENRIASNAAAKDNETINSVLAVLAKDKLQPSAGERDIATMVLSKANGHKQIGQLVAARGELEGCYKDYNGNGERRQFASSLVDGMTWKDAFDASWNARLTLCDKKLGTAKGGGLTRKLVLALWPLAIVEDDCGSDEAQRSPLTCKSKNGFCRVCCESAPNGGNAVSGRRFLPIGFPVGLVAAQSIGERGTQLSMKSFQTGHTAETGLEALDDCLKNGGNDMDYLAFYRNVAGKPSILERSDDEAGNEYAKLDELHFMVLWCALCAGRFESPSRDNWVELLKGSEQLKAITEIARAGDALPLDSPMAKVIFGLF